MKGSRVGDCLNVIHRGKVSIVAGNSREFPRLQPRNRLWETAPKIWILRAAAIARPPTRVHSKLHQVGQAPDVLRAGRLTTRQRAEFIQVDRLSALRYQVGIDELFVAQLILSIVV